MADDDKKKESGMNFALLDALIFFGALMLIIILWFMRGVPKNIPSGFFISPTVPVTTGAPTVQK